MAHATTSSCLLLLLLTLWTTLSFCLGDEDSNLAWVHIPQNQAVPEGHDLILDCQARLASPSGRLVTVTYSWRLDGEPLPAKASVFTNHSLLVPRLGQADRGVYRCHVTCQVDGGQGGELVASAVVMLAYLDHFLIQPVSQIVSYMDQVVLTCVTGQSAPTLKVEWRRNGKAFTEGTQMTASFGNHDALNLRQQTSLRLEFKATFDSVGLFQCLAHNEALGKTVLSQKANISIQSAMSDSLPQIDWQLPDTLVKAEGQDLVLSCTSAVSSEPVSVDWFMGRYLVDESKRVYVLANRSLAILPVSAKDSGTYKCRMTNSKGSTMSPTLTLVVAYIEIRFKEEPSNTFALYGQSVTLRCQPPMSVPKASVAWYKDFKIIKPDGGHIRVIENNLYLDTVGKSDMGDYYCVAQNPISHPSSRTSKLAKLTVEGQPHITSPPEDTEILKGTLLHLSCMASSDPLPVVSWEFEGHAFEINSRVSIINHGQELWVANVDKALEGVYTCHCRNKYGKVSAQALVTVIVPPVALKTIGLITVTAGDNLTIPCSIVGDPQPAIQWFYNGNQLTSKGNNSTWTVRKQDLYIGRVTADLKGIYKCVGTNKGGSVSSQGELRVNVPPHSGKNHATVSAILGYSVTLTCGIQGHPTPSLKWTFNESSTLPAGFEFESRNVTATLPHVGWDEVGVYSCIGQNVAGTAREATTVKLLVPPSILRVTSPSSPVRIQQKFSLTCFAAGIPSPSLSWMHQGEAIHSSLNGRVRLLPDGNTLQVGSAQESDSGEYQCVATSDLGTVKKSVSVTVYGPPPPPVLVKAVPISPESVYLVWSWSSPGTESPSSLTFSIFYRERTSLEISQVPTVFSLNKTRAEVVGLKPGTAYVFTVYANNDAGKSQVSNQLMATTHSAGPSAPVNLKTIKVGATSASLTWEVPLSPNGNVKRYQFRYKRQETSQDYTIVDITHPMFPTHEVSLTSLRPYTSYIAQVQAGNLFQGTLLWGRFCPDVTFRTNMTVPSLAPSNITVKAIDAYSIEISWKEIPLIAQNGPVLFYRIFYSNNETQFTGSKRVNGALRTLSFFGLYPWRQYAITLVGENAVGRGPSSSPVLVKTLPIAPITTPVDFKAIASSSSAIELSWERISSHISTCKVTFYIIQHRLQTSSTWRRIHIPSDKISYTLEFLRPWSTYLFKISAFTDTVVPGQGPFTNDILARTLQGKPGPATNISFKADIDHISLSWEAPNVHGILAGYQVDFHPVGQEGLVPAERLNLSGKKHSIELLNLRPDTAYNISIAVRNEAQWSAAVTLTVQTLPLTPSTEMQVTTELPTTTVYNVTYEPLVQRSGSMRKHIASIVAGTLVGLVAFIIFVVFVCVKCIRYRRKQRLNYEYHAYFNQGYTTQVL